MDSRFSIIPARPRDLAALATIEREAAAMLADHIPEDVRNETVAEADLLEAQADGRLWVALLGDVAVGFAIVHVLEDGEPHLHEIDVLPSQGRQGIGAELVRTACAWAALSAHQSLTLTTFRDIPWNGPFYRSLGFEEIAGDRLGAALRAVIADESARGLDSSRRVAMRFDCRKNADRRS